MIWRRNARRLPPTGATPSPYPLTRLPVGAYLLVFSDLSSSMYRLKPTYCLFDIQNEIRTSKSNHLFVLNPSALNPFLQSLPISTLSVLTFFGKMVIVIKYQKKDG